MLKALPALGALCAAAALLVPTVSQAESLDSVVVAYGDINLAELSGQRQLLRRISYAADSVCAVSRSLDHAVAQADRSCTTGAIDRARPAYEAAVQNYRRGTVTVLGAANLIVTSK